MNKEIDIKDMAPVKASERHVILDALRGFALLGICFANFPEFSLYTFQKPERENIFAEIFRFFPWVPFQMDSNPI